MFACGPIWYVWWKISKNIMPVIKLDLDYLKMPFVPVLISLLHLPLLSHTTWSSFRGCCRPMPYFVHTRALFVAILCYNATQLNHRCEKMFTHSNSRSLYLSVSFLNVVNMVAQVLMGLKMWLRMLCTHISDGVYQV